MISLQFLLKLIAFILVLIGTLLNYIALATPSWQVVYARELLQWVKSGLWMNCQTRPSGMLFCAYSFSKSDRNIYTSSDILNIRTPAFYDWHHNLFYTILFGQLFAMLGILSFCLSQAVNIRNKCMIFMCIAIALASLMNIASNIAFLIHAHMVEYRFYHVSVSGIYEKQLGFSYFLHLFGSLILIVAVFFIIVHLVLLHQEDNGELRSIPFTRCQDQFADSDDDFFAMRALPPPPPKYVK